MCKDSSLLSLEKRGGGGSNILHGTRASIAQIDLYDMAHVIILINAH